MLRLLWRLITSSASCSSAFLSQRSNIAPALRLDSLTLGEFWRRSGSLDLVGAHAFDALSTVSGSVLRPAAELVVLVLAGDTCLLLQPHDKGHQGRSAGASLSDRRFGPRCLSQADAEGRLLPQLHLQEPAGPHHATLAKAHQGKATSATDCLWAGSPPDQCRCCGNSVLFAGGSTP